MKKPMDCFEGHPREPCEILDDVRWLGFKNAMKSGIASRLRSYMAPYLPRHSLTKDASRSSSMTSRIVGVAIMSVRHCCGYVQH